MKKMNKVTILTSIICLIPVIAGIVLYPQLPEQIATHWGINGEPDGYSSKLLGAIILPLVMLVANVLIPAILAMDPKSENMNKQLKNLVYWIFPIIAVICSGTTLATAMGKKVQIVLILPMLVGVMFVCIGNYLPKTKQSYTMGIRIPWTLNSEENWNATHRMAGFLWVAGGILILVTSWTPLRYSFFIIITVVMVIVPIIYSYMYYRKESKK